MVCCNLNCSGHRDKYFDFDIETEAEVLRHLLYYRTYYILYYRTYQKCLKLCILYSVTIKVKHMGPLQIKMNIKSETVM
jgi:hypothetical protein